jgi:hypothetical protein
VEAYRTAFYRLPAKTQTDAAPICFFDFPPETTVKPAVILLSIIWFPMALVVIPALKNPVFTQAMSGVIFVFWGIPILQIGLALYSRYMAKERPRDVEKWKETHICWHCGQNFYPDFCSLSNVSDYGAFRSGEADASRHEKRFLVKSGTRRRNKPPKYIYEHEYTRQKQKTAWISWLYKGMGTAF